MSNAIPTFPSDDDTDVDFLEAPGPDVGPEGQAFKNPERPSAGAASSAKDTSQPRPLSPDAVVRHWTAKIDQPSNGLPNSEKQRAKDGLILLENAAKAPLAAGETPRDALVKAQQQARERDPQGQGTEVRDYETALSLWDDAQGDSEAVRTNLTRLDGINAQRAMDSVRAQVQREVAVVEDYGDTPALPADLARLAEHHALAAKAKSMSTEKFDSKLHNESIEARKQTDAVAGVVAEWESSASPSEIEDPRNFYLYLNGEVEKAKKELHKVSAENGDIVPARDKYDKLKGVKMYAKTWAKDSEYVARIANKEKQMAPLDPTALAKFAEHHASLATKRLQTEPEMDQKTKRQLVAVQNQADAVASVVAEWKATAPPSERADPRNFYSHLKGELEAVTERFDQEAAEKGKATAPTATRYAELNSAHKFADTWAKNKQFVERTVEKNSTKT